jgi:Cytochrome C oxidase, cbb3-type, subunit III
MRTVLLHRDRDPLPLTTILLAGLLAGCGGGDRPPAEGAPAGDTAAAAAPATPPPAADTTAAGGAAQPAGDTGKAAAGGAAGGGGAQGDAAAIALGDSIFHGQVAGATCYACHGQNGEGSAVGAKLNDSEWLHGDGSLAAIEKTIQAGVPKPKQAPAPMPPMGGAALTPEQVKAAAAYVYSLSHKG